MFTAPEIRERIGNYLSQLDLKYEVVGDTVWLIRDPDRGLTQVVVFADENLVTIRARLMPIPGTDCQRFFEELLRFNVEMLHGAYALEDDTVIWLDTLEFSTMDLEELQASLDAASLCMLQYVPRLEQYCGGDEDGSV